MLKIAWNEHYHHPLPEGHRFPMEKYTLLPEQLLYEGTVNRDNFFSPEAVVDKEILQVHRKDYWDKLQHGGLDKAEIRRTGFPYSPSLVRREVEIAGGTVKGALFALEHGVAMNIAGGTHHAFTDRGEGFCLLNDIAIAAKFLLDQLLVEKVLVVDLDVHQGNGTAEIFRNEPWVFTFSMHGERNYPLKKENSDLDVDLADGTDDRLYLKELKNHLPRLIQEQEPGFVFFQSGVDVLKTDKLGRLGLTIEGCKERDQFVFEICRKNDIPVMVSMGGGYSERIADIIEAHANTYRLAQEMYF
ncbi:MAG TPA: histone deacetylase [Cytophagales bacterium]|jgi:acetoin utilization deacetylase AcuC-like enzyme|nr:histone deacetylase [Cytophagales bacterium]